MKLPVAKNLPVCRIGGRAESSHDLESEPEQLEIVVSVATVKGSSHVINIKK